MRQARDIHYVITIEIETSFPVLTYLPTVPASPARAPYL